jgi:hypothetical protein
MSDSENVKANHKSKVSPSVSQLSNYNKSNDVSIDYKEYKINFLIISISLNNDIYNTVQNNNKGKYNIYK